MESYGVCTSANKKKMEKTVSEKSIRQLMRDVCLGKRKADLVLTGGKLVNVFTGEILEESLAVCQGTIVGIGPYEGKKTVDLQGKYVLPGLIDAHLHIESSMAIPSVLSSVLLAHGVTTAIVDPHEIVNAAGSKGLDYMLEDAAISDVEYCFMLPSSVPSCDFEVNGGGEFSARKMQSYLEHPQVLGLGEVMRFQDVLDGESRMQAKLDCFKGKVIDGHAPGLSFQELQAYAMAGIENDHEASTPDEAIERLRAGLWLLIRQGSGAKNLEDLLGALLKRGLPLDRCAFCTDDKHLEDMMEEGTIDDCLRQAVRLGCDPVQAIRMATLQPALHYGLKTKGALAAGYDADLVVVDDLSEFSIAGVWKSGKRIDGKPDSSSLKSLPVPSALQNSVQLPAFEASDLWPLFNTVAIRTVPFQLLTEIQSVESLAVFGESGPEKPLWKGTDWPEEEGCRMNLLCAMERYGKTGEFACCLLAGFGLRQGAIAASYAHDSHNAIAAGDNASDIALALKTLEDIGGGFVLVEKGEVFQTLPLEAAGLMSAQPASVLENILHRMKSRARSMGTAPGVDPFATLSFLSLPVIPSVRLLPQGLYDVEKGRFLQPSNKT